ncbi:MAG: TIGR04219 family outer membrane beta-barrel protein [Porticoccaceae bacterium]|nr:TIGR04219 family outer membrane beta-barrel protein [Porticoccaceae bacterium]
MKTKTIATAITLALGVAATTAQADTVLGLYAGAGQWKSELSGDVGVTSTDFSTLGFNEENNNMFYLALEHPVPAIPNIMVKRTDLSTTGSATLQGNVQFDNVLFPSGTSLATDIDLDHTDATFYYEVLDNWINLDLGLTARQYKGQLTASNDDLVPLSETVELDAVIPLVYVKGQIDLPFTGFSIKGEANAIVYSGDSISDVSAAVAWQDDFLVAFDLGVELGYRRMNLEIDDLGDLQTDLTIDGPYLSLNAHF